MEVEHLLHFDHPLSSRIEIFYHRENLNFHKPDPKVFNQALKYFNVSPSESVYVGDSISDAEAAKGAGLHLIALLESGLRNKEDFKNFEVDLFSDKFPKITDYILNN